LSILKRILFFIAFCFTVPGATANPVVPFSFLHPIRQHAAHRVSKKKQVELILLDSYYDADELQ